MIDQEQVGFYRTNGYLVVENVLSADEVRALVALTDQIVAGAAGLASHDDIYDLEPGHTPEAPRVRRIKLPHNVHPDYRRLAEHPGIIGAIAPLIGADIRLRGGKINIKAAESGAPVEWHQDWAFYPQTNDDVLAVGVMLDDATLDNGPLMVLPGTHVGPTFDHHADGSFCGAMDPVACGLDFSKAVPLTGAAGSISIHHARLVHGSMQNRSTRRRSLLLFEYTAADAWPLMGVGDFEAFDRGMVAGSPTIRPRIVPAPVRMPLPAAVHQGSIYENQRTLPNRYFEDRHQAEPVGAD